MHAHYAMIVSCALIGRGWAMVLNTYPSCF